MGKPLWCLGLALGAGVIATDRFLHLLPDWLAIVLFVIAWVLIIAGIWQEKVKKLWFAHYAGCVDTDVGR